MRRLPRFSDENLRAVLQTLGVVEAGDVFSLLKTAYSDPVRHYHTDAHVTECLLLLDRFTHLANRPGEVEIAIWFHDAVYDTKRSDNEEASAEWARRFLTSVNVEQDAIDRVTAMILATKTHESNDIDCELLLDIDLSILGTDSDIFEAYDRAIRQEYDWVRQEQYVVARMAILNSFLSRPRIFRTAEFFRTHEEQARDNLQRKVLQLGAQVADEAGE